MRLARAAGRVFVAAHHHVVALTVTDDDGATDTAKTPVVVDGRNLYDPQRMRTLGFSYTGIGRATA